MAKKASKRSAPLKDEEDEEFQEPPSQRRKEEDGDEEFDADDLEEVEEDEQDEDFDDEEEEDEKPKKKKAKKSNKASSDDPHDVLAGRSKNASDRPPEAGVIHQIYCENFMCHRKLKVTMNQNINFISGANGSGKSAILAAIQICLGAGARKTHRAATLKDLVRKDANCTHAKIMVTVLNGGDDAFHPEIYGKRITVERTIALAGGYNGYKLLDERGVEQSRSKKDLDDMLDKLNIQVENPVAILDQEEAKKFLTGKSSEKYSFFMKATELERIDRTYSTSIQHVNELETQKQRMDNGLDGDKELVAKAEQDWKKVTELQKQEHKKQKLAEGLAWAHYNQAKDSWDNALAVSILLASRYEYATYRTSSALDGFFLSFSNIFNCSVNPPFQLIGKRKILAKDCEATAGVDPVRRAGIAARD